MNTITKMAAAAAATALLAGCAGAEVATPQPEPTLERIFTADTVAATQQCFTAISDLGTTLGVVRQRSSEYDAVELLCDAAIARIEYDADPEVSLPITGAILEEMMYLSFASLQAIVDGKYADPRYDFPGGDLYATEESVMGALEAAEEVSA